MYISLKFFTGIITASTTGISPNTTITGTGITPPTNGKLVYQDIIKVTRSSHCGNTITPHSSGYHTTFVKKVV